MHMRKRAIEDRSIEAVVRQWVAPQEIHADSVICDACFSLAVEVMEETPGASQPITTFGHRHVCVVCGRSVLRRRSHMLSTDTDRERHIRDVVAERILPRQLLSRELICHPCWQRCDRAPAVPQPPASPSASPLDSPRTSPPLPSSPSPLHLHQSNVDAEATIYLPNYGRAVDTQSHCFVPGCNMSERRVIPKSLRVWLFRNYKYYVPSNSRICGHHLQSNTWHSLPVVEDMCHEFTTAQIEDFASFVKYRFDFENVDT